MSVDNELDPQELAFERSADMQWGGKALEPFSYLRKTASIRLGMRYWKLQPGEIELVSGEENGEQWQLEVYDHLAEDCAITLWLCSQDDAMCRRARRDPEWAQAEIDVWAEGKIFGKGMDLQPEAYVAFLQIVRDIHASEFDVESEKKTQPEIVEPEQSANPSST